tara:strand:- start:1291 stop:2634 length:1344 start_codon:yes stop_codon:yes gene_type:complete
MNVLQINTTDLNGGAAKVAFSLFEGLEEYIDNSSLAVGIKRSINPNVLDLSQFRLQRKNRKKTNEIILPKIFLDNNTMQRLFNYNNMIKMKKIFSFPRTMINYYSGKENFYFPETEILLHKFPSKNSIIHLHNLHGDYFDLRILPRLFSSFPIMVTLHDAWMISGHCAHSFDCERWMKGCGQCPDLNIYQSIRRDKTSYNWSRKKNIYSKCRFFIATPSNWLLQKVKNSMLINSIIESQVIPNGVDQSIFKPSSKSELRLKLGLPQNAHIVLFVSKGIKTNPWKDFSTLHEAIVELSKKFGYNSKSILFLCLGERNNNEKINNSRIKFIPYQNDPLVVADYYCAADVYIHIALEESFSLAIAEAMSCGLPIIASNVGAIPELIVDGKNGFLVQPESPKEIVHKLEILLTNDKLRECLSKKCLIMAKDKYNLSDQIQAYYDWYQHILS